MISIASLYVPEKYGEAGTNSMALHGATFRACTAVTENAVAAAAVNAFLAFTMKSERFISTSLSPLLLLLVRAECGFV